MTSLIAKKRRHEEAFPPGANISVLLPHRKLDHFPLDILNIIFDFCDPPTLFSLRFVNRRFRNIIPYNHKRTFHVCEEAGAKGYLRLLKWVRTMKVPWNNTFTCAVDKDSVDMKMIRWLRSQNAPGKFNACNRAALRGHIVVLKFLLPVYTTQISTICSQAAAGGHVNILRWARGRTRKYHWNVETSLNAALNGHLDALQFLHENRCPININLANFAARNGHIPILMYARTIGLQFDSTTMNDAAAREQIDTVKWLHAIGCPWTAQTATNAARTGNLKLLQYILQNGCEWHDSIFNEAALHGHFEMVKWIYQRHPMNLFTSKFIAQSGNLAMLDWAFQHGCPWSKNDILPNAAGSGNIDMMIFLVDKGATLSKVACNEAASKGHHEALKWLRSQGCPWDEQTTSEAAQNGKLETLEFALENGCPFFPSLWNQAARNGHFHILLWAYGKDYQFTEQTLEGVSNKMILRWLNSVV